MGSLMTLRWAGGQNWFLDGPGGQSIAFADDAAVDAFQDAMIGGPDVFISAVLNQNIFPSIAAGDMDAVTAFYNTYFEGSNALMVSGEAEEFLAADEGVDSIAACIVEAGEWLAALFFLLKAGEAKGNVIKVPSDSKKEDFRRFKAIVKDPKKRADALQIREAFLAKASLKKDDSSKADLVDPNTVPDYAQTWFNLTGGDTLTLAGQYLFPSSIMYVQSYPAQSFQIGSQALAWSWIASGFAQGTMDGDVIWNAPNGSWFGVNVHVPAQFLGAGTAPYYQVCWSEPGKTDWFTPVDDPATPFSFPTSLGYQIDITTSCGHASIAVTIKVAKLHTGE